MPTDLEERLERLGLNVPRPSTEMRERARQAALEALPRSEPDSTTANDVRGQRRTRHRRPWVLAFSAVILAVGVMLATPAFGFRDGLFDFLTGENAKQPEATIESATCPPGSFEFAFDALKGAVVTTNGSRLAFASYSTRAITGSCTPIPQIDINSYSDALLDPTARYRAANVVCTAPAGFNVDVHPIVVFDEQGTRTPELDGTNLIVSVGAAEKSEIIVSAVLKNRDEGLRASRLYYAPKYCHDG
jgi:hypothetical protein